MWENSGESIIPIRGKEGQSVFWQVRKATGETESGMKKMMKRSSIDESSQEVFSFILMIFPIFTERLLKLHLTDPLCRVQAISPLPASLSIPLFQTLHFFLFAFIWENWTQIYETYRHNRTIGKHLKSNLDSRKCSYVNACETHIVTNTAESTKYRHLEAA